MEKDDQREGMSEASKDISDQTRGEDKSQMATKDQSDKTKGEMMDELEGDIETLSRMVEALMDYSVYTRCMVRALMYFTDKNGLLPPDDEAFRRKAEEAFEVSGDECVARFLQRNVPVGIVSPSGEAIRLKGFVKADGDEKESTPQPGAEMKADTTSERDCDNCGRSTPHEFVGWKPLSIPPFFEHSGCYLVIFQCQNCGHLHQVMRIPSDSPLWIDPELGSENGEGHEV